MSKASIAKFGGDIMARKRTEVKIDRLIADNPSVNIAKLADSLTPKDLARVYIDNKKKIHSTKSTSPTRKSPLKGSMAHA